MGIGDQVPVGLQQLGAQVTLLDERELASGRPVAFDAIVTGTRAYAVREDLKTYNQRLLDYVEGRRQPDRALQHAGARAESVRAVPGRATPRDAEEVSEEDSPVDDPGADAPGFNWPNKITQGRLRGLGRAARLEVLEHVGRGLHADHRHLRQGPAAAAGRLAVGEVRQGHTTPTSPTRSTASCRTACRRVSPHGEPAGAGQASPARR